MIQINRGLTPGQYKIADIFPELRAKPILGEIFRSKQEIEDVIANTNVIIIDRHHEIVSTAANWGSCSGTRMSALSLIFSIMS